MHAYSHLLKELKPHGTYYSLPDLKDPRYDELPYCIRVLLEAAVRCCDGFNVTKDHVEHILNWKTTSCTSTEVPFKPSRVLLQDLTGVPAAVDLAAMRDAVHKFNEDPNSINPLVPVDLVIDHSVQVDVSRVTNAYLENQDIEFERNKERFTFLKWAATVFQNLQIIPPGSGIVHQVNLEYLARVVFNDHGLLYPDSVVGTDSHTTMIDGLGVAGWGVGGIEAEAVMLGQPICMTLPQVVGFELTGEMPCGVTATDLVLKVTRMLRDKGVVGKFVEFYGVGCKYLSIADRATISNMSPEYGATMGFFPVDEQSLVYLKQTGRSDDMIDRVEKYCQAQRLFRKYDDNDDKIVYSGEPLTLDLSSLVPCVAGPKRPHDYVSIKDMKSDFETSLTAPIGFKGYGLDEQAAKNVAEFQFRDQTYTFRNGTIVIAAITSCTNTSNPSVMIGAGLIAKKAVELGLKVQPFIKTSLSPGSLTVTQYIQAAGLTSYLEQLGFYTTGFGCQTCIGNSGSLDVEVANVIQSSNLIAAAVLSGNRNFEGRIHPLTRANYLMSPMLVVIFALAGTVDIDLETMPVGHNPKGEPVFAKDLWPSNQCINELVNRTVLAATFKSVYSSITDGGSASWQSVSTPASKLYPWDPKSTYIHDPPYLKSMSLVPDPIQNIVNAHCLLFLGDSVTTDHISPAGAIARGSPAAQYLEANGIAQKDFNTYGSRRGHDEVMMRGTFANVRIINKLATKVGPYTKHIPSRKSMFIFDASMAYKQQNTPLIVLAGKEYGSGSSRDWAAKGPKLLGIRAIIAESYERIHRTNLLGMGIMPLQFISGQNAESLNLTGEETFSINLDEMLYPSEKIKVNVVNCYNETRQFEVLSRIDTPVELEYFKHGGILQYVLRKIITKK